VELLHQFSLVHDDIQNGSPDREGRSAVWWLWGPAQGINVGDGLHALARLSLFGLEDQGMPTPRLLRAARLLDQACLRLFEGQYHELLFQEQAQVLEGAYFSMVEKRAGALWGCAAGLGALSAGADDEALALCQHGGEKLGVAFQIQQDILELWGGAGGEPPGGGLLNKRKSLPVIHALTTGEPQTRRELATLYLQRVLEPKDVVRVVALLDDAGSREYCQALVETATHEALETLAQAGVAGETLAEVRRLTQMVLERHGNIPLLTDSSGA
jgi:geranylgeranyl diphosphate synthase type I